MQLNASLINAYSERLMPPYSGQVQIAQSGTYRALTIDGQIWEIQYVNRSHVRVATLKAEDIKSGNVSAEQMEGGEVDPELVRLLDYLAEVNLPFPACDCYEYWLLDTQDDAPLALVFSCCEAAQMEKFPARTEWTALPAAVMPVDKTDQEIADQLPPVNYRLERLVAERAGTRCRAKWFDRRVDYGIEFPELMVTENWPDADAASLCRRYLQRQAPRLLMLHGLTHVCRQRLESWCRSEAPEVARFWELYPEILDEESLQALRVEARFRAAHDRDGQPSVQSRRDGVLYI